MQNRHPKLIGVAKQNISVSTTTRCCFCFNFLLLSSSKVYKKSKANGSIFCGNSFAGRQGCWNMMLKHVQNCSSTKFKPKETNAKQTKTKQHPGNIWNICSTIISVMGHARTRGFGITFQLSPTLIIFSHTKTRPLISGKKNTTKTKKPTTTSKPPNFISFFLIPKWQTHIWPLLPPFFHHFWAYWVATAGANDVRNIEFGCPH